MSCHAHYRPLLAAAENVTLELLSSLSIQSHHAAPAAPGHGEKRDSAALSAILHLHTCCGLKQTRPVSRVKI